VPLQRPCITALSGPWLFTLWGRGPIGRRAGAAR